MSLRYFKRQIFFLALGMLCVSPYMIKGQDELFESKIQFAAPLEQVRDTNEILELVKKSREYRKSEPDSAIGLIVHAFNESRRLGWTRGALGVLVELGNVYHDMGSYKQALNYFNLALAFAHTAQQYRSISTIYNNIGNAYNGLGMHSASLQAMYHAIAYAEHHESTMSASMIYSNLASKLRPEDGLYYIERAERALVKDSNYAALGQIYINKGIILYKLEGLESNASKACFFKALELGEQYQLERILQSSLSNLGGWYLNAKMFDSALYYLEKAVSLHGDGRISERDKEHAMTLLAGTYYGLGRIDASEQILTELLRRSPDMPLSTKGNVHSALATIYLAKKDWQKVIYHKDQLLAVKDSISKQESNQIARTLEVKFRTAQKDKELAEKELLITNQKRDIETKNLWITVIAVGASLSVFILIVVYRNYRHKQAIHENRIRILQQEQEIGHLKAMMKGEERERVRIARELHDGIGGMLTAVKMNLGTARNKHPELARLSFIDEIVKMLDETNEEVRKTAHNLMPDVLIKHGLEEALMIYCAHVNSGGGLQIDVQFQGDLDDLEKGVELFLYRIAQELIQNIIKHAQARQAMLLVMRNGDRISVTVEDDGVGFDPETESGGFGLQNLKYRIQALEGILSIMSAVGKSTTVYIEFDIKKLILAIS